MASTQTSENKAPRQCWGCLKRRLVCDRTLPHCGKCQKLGKECLGYEEQKPLQWVQPGKVTSRRRKNDSAPTVYKIPLRGISRSSSPEPDAGEQSPPSKSPPSDVVAKSLPKQQFFAPWKSTVEEKWGYLAETHEEKVSREDAFMDASSRGIIDTIFAIGGRSQLERIVRNGLREEAAHMMSAEPQPLKRLERILRIMESFDIPDYNYLLTDANVVVQAVNYYNTRIHPTVKASGELAPNPALIQFPLGALHMLPPAIHHTVVCLSLNHFIHTLPVGANKDVTISTRSKIYQHRGAAIRSLSQYVGKDKTRCSDLAISSILMFLAMELQNPPIANWRSHASGLNQLIHLRGGLRSLMKQSPYLAPTVAIFMLIVTLGNTCSPSWDQIPLNGSHAQDLSDIESIYSILFPYTLCPPTLYLSIIRISHLRAETSSFFPDASHCLTAHDLLSLIESFRPEDWAQPGPHFDEWLLIGRIYQSAAALYCTMALQSLTILPSSLEMNAMRSVHGARLLADLRQALKTPRLTCFVLWPLTIAGVEAGYRNANTRYWIAARLEELARLLGTSGPLKSLAVLRRYWEKRERGWDVCFDQPECTLVPWMGC